MGNLSYTVSGNPAQFKSAARVPITSLKCNFLPKQNLHGYSGPWIGGQGKNLLKCTRAVGEREITANFKFTTNSDGSIKVTGDPVADSGLITSKSVTLPAGTYILNGCPSGGSDNTFYLNGYNGIDVKDYGSGATFTLTGETTFNIRIAWTAGASMNGKTFYPMIRLASNNDATWEPYENICPIEGWNEVTAWHIGKNIIGSKTATSLTNMELKNGIYTNTITSSGTTSYKIGLISRGTRVGIVTVNATISIGRNSFSVNIPSSAYVNYCDEIRFEIINGSKNFYIYFPCKFYTTGYYKCSFTLVKNDLSVVGGYAIKDFQLEYPDTLTNYEPSSYEKIPVTFPGVGKNLLDPNNYYFAGTGALIFGGGASSIPDGSIYLKAGTYTFSCDVTCNALGGSYGTGGFLGVATNATSFTFTLNSDNVVRLIVSKTNATEEDFQSYHYQLEKNSTATEYEPFNNTVYGGYVDIAKGEVVATHGIVNTTWGNYDHNMDNITGGNQVIGQYERRCFTINPAFKSSSNNPGLISNIMTKYDYGYYDDNAFFTAGNQLAILKLPTTTDDSLPIQIVGLLATPITYSLSPLELQTFLNQNTIYSNINSTMEVSYAIHDSALMRATRARIAANEPHLATINSSIASFNTDMIAPLKECKVNFLPFQDGNGDPSPNNIRKIIGTQGGTVLALGEEINIEPIDFEPIELDGGTLRYLGNGTFYLDGTLNSNAKILIPISPFNISLNYNYCVTMEASSTNILQIYAIAFRTNSSRIVSITKTPPSNSCFDKEYSYWASNTEALCEILNLGFAANSSNTTIKIHLFRNTNSQFENTFFWKNSLGTIYGGYVDLVNGVVIATHALTTPNGNNWIIAGNGTFQNGHLEALTELNSTFYEQNVLCSHNKWDASRYVHVNGIGQLIANKAFWTSAGLSTISDSTIAAYCADQANNGTPIQVSYPLLTPITYQLTPTILKTLRGTNNIWSNSNDNTEVTYWTH